MNESFFERDGERFRATELTRGPWTDDAQHGGPATALLARAIEREAGEGHFVARVTGLVLREDPLTLPPLEPKIAPMPAPDSCPSFSFPFFSATVGYHTAMELRLARGRFGEGAMALWFRMKYPLVDGETPTPLQA